jgi:hypothetical protein
MALHKLALAVFVAAILGGAVFLSQKSNRSDDRDGAEREAMRIMKDLAAVMESVKDRESARVAAARIEGICDRLEMLVRRAQNLPAIPPEEQQKRQERFDAEMGPTNARMYDLGKQAALNAQGEPAFISAAQRLIQVNQKWKEVGLRQRN